MTNFMTFVAFLCNLGIYTIWLTPFLFVIELFNGIAIIVKGDKNYKFEIIVCGCSLFFFVMGAATLALYLRGM